MRHQAQYSVSAQHIRSIFIIAVRVSTEGGLGKILVWQAFDQGNSEPDPVNRWPGSEGQPVAYRRGRAVDGRQLTPRTPTHNPSYF